MNAIAIAHDRPVPQTSARAATSPLRELGQVLARTAAILVAAGVILAGATAVGYSPLASQLPGSFLPFAQQQHQGAPVGTGATRGAAGSPAGSSAGSGGLFTGRNAPSLQSGLRQELPNLAIFGGLTAISALALGLLSGSRRRRPPSRPATPGRSGPAQCPSQPPAIRLQSA